MTVDVIQKATATATYGGAGSAVYFGLTAHELAAFGGLLVAVVAGVANVWINWHYRKKHYRLAEERAENEGWVNRQRGAINRTLVAGMGLSAAAFIGLVAHEGYVGEAMIPTKNDRPTIGFGSTFHEDGRPVRMGERTDPVRALVKAQTHISKEEERFRASLPGVKLHQAEYDVFADFVYQYGTGTWSRSSMRRHLLAGDHRAACDALLLYKFAGGFDCSTPGNRVCAGVWARQLERHAQCMAVQ